MAAPRNNPKAFAEWYELDYFRRPRHSGTMRWALWGTAIVCLAAVAVTFAWPGGRVAYQAGPLSEPHAFLAENCTACHTESFATARRFLPAEHDVRATPDTACLQCHEAGAHSAHQMRLTGADGQAANCAGCHREHRGGRSLARLDDAHCTACHADLTTDDGQHRFARTISAFTTDHPEFGAWRGSPLTDPGTLRFNHQLHLNLANDLKDVRAQRPERLGPMAEPLKRLEEQSCASCHEPDATRQYMRPVRYESHCAGCHALTTRPAGDWPPDEVRAWVREPLPHPGRGQTAAVVRGALLARYWKLVAGAEPAGPQPRPPLLDRPLPPLTAEQRERVRSLAEQAEKDLFAARDERQAGDFLKRLHAAPSAPGAVGDLERPLFVLRGGCAYCHERTGTRPDGLPDYAPPRQTERWLPYARFGHESHRLLDCAACHKDAPASTKTSDVLLPALADCRACHTPQVGVRSDCVECHRYHDRGREPQGLRGRFSIGEAIDAARPSPTTSGR